MYAVFCTVFYPDSRFHIPHSILHTCPPIRRPYTVPPGPCSYPNPIDDTRVAAPLSSDQPRPCGWPIVPSGPRDRRVNTVHSVLVRNRSHLRGLLQVELLPEPSPHLVSIEFPTCSLVRDRHTVEVQFARLKHSWAFSLYPLLRLLPLCMSRNTSPKRAEGVIFCSYLTAPYKAVRGAPWRRRGIQFSAHVGPTRRLKLAAAEARHAPARLSLGWSNAVLRLSVFRLIGPGQGTTQG